MYPASYFIPQKCPPVMKTVVFMSSGHAKEQECFLGKRGKSRSIKAISCATFLGHFLYSFILDLGVIMLGPFSKDAAKIKTTLRLSSLRKEFSFFKYMLLFISVSQVSEEPFTEFLIDNRCHKSSGEYVNRLWLQNKGNTRATIMGCCPVRSECWG